MLYVRVSCPVVRGCAVSRRYIDVCNCGVFSVVIVYLYHLKCCIVYIYGRQYVCCSECNVVANECDDPTPFLVQPLLLYAFRDLWKEWGDSNFQIFSQNCQFHHRRLESLEHFKSIFRNHYEPYGLIFRGYHIIFVQGVLFFHFVYTLHVCYVFNVI